jgi:Flp pilus assembly protein TadB
MSDKKTTANSGIGFCGLLTVAFIVLKLCGVISWSWVWVLSPIWISIAGVLAIAIVIILFVVIRELVKQSRR